MIHRRSVFLVPASIALALFACSSDDTGSSAGSTQDAGVDVSTDAPLDVEPDVGSDTSADAEPDAADSGPDVSPDAPPDAPTEAAPDAAATWEGPPWYGCTADDEPPTATVVTAFDLADQYWGDEDLRTIEAQVDFPAAGSWERIDMIIELSCPADGDCDNWDRFANVMLVQDAGTASEEALELERYMTPYNEGMCIRTDVTRFAPRLAGTKTLRSFIDTWVGPNTLGQGHGWRTTVKFVFHPGTPDPGVVPGSLVSVWPLDSVEIGNPDAPFSDAMGTKTVTIPAGTTRAELRVLASGHGQGNRFNCSEFCPMAHELTVNGTAFTFNNWRDDCAQNPVSPQAGTWQYNRSGWCPGAYAVPEVIDITSAVQPGQEATIGYDTYSEIHGVYENTCRPGAGDANNVCELCAFSDDPGNCDYNGGNHTAPVHKISVQLLLYP